MPTYLIDANLPRYFGLWNTPEHVHQHELDPAQEDRGIWEYARARALTIVTKDSDFSGRILLAEPPPKVIHIRLGNMSMRQFHEAVVKRWPQVVEMSATHKLVVVYEDRIEGVR